MTRLCREVVADLHDRRDLRLVCAVPIAIAIMRRRGAGRRRGVERLAFRVDSDVRVVLQHPARQMTADGLEDVVRRAHLCQLGDNGVPQIVEPEAWQARRITERSPGREAACPEGDAVCGCGSLISKWLCERSRFRTVLKSGSGLSVAALWAGALQCSARIVPLGDDPKRTDRRQRAALSAIDLVYTVALPNRPALPPTWESRSFADTSRR